MRSLLDFVAEGRALYEANAKKIPPAGDWPPTLRFERPDGEQTSMRLGGNPFADAATKDAVDEAVWDAVWHSGAVFVSAGWVAYSVTRELSEPQPGEPGFVQPLDDPAAREVLLSFAMALDGEMSYGVAPVIREGREHPRLGPWEDSELGDKVDGRIITPIKVALRQRRVLVEDPAAALRKKLAEVEAGRALPEWVSREDTCEMLREGIALIEADPEGAAAMPAAIWLREREAARGGREAEGV